MNTETVTKTVIFPLETSSRKNDRVEDMVNEWQRIAGRINDLMPSIGPVHWTAQDTTLFHLVQNEFSDHNLRAHDAYQAAYQVGESWGSWDSNGREGNPPEFGEGDWARLCHCGIEFAENDRGYGVKLKLEPYNPEWFHITGGEFQKETLEGIINGDVSGGGGVVMLDNGQLRLHQSVSVDVDVLEWGEIQHRIGVDLGERVMWAATATSEGSVKGVEMESGAEYRHHRERLKRKREQFMEQGKIKKVKDARNQYDTYTDHITHVASREIVDFARQFNKPGIVLEELTDYRNTADNPIHDWPYSDLQEKIMYKATEEGIPVKKVDPVDTSITCRKCGSVEQTTRDGPEFNCHNCGYEVHADVNAAINIAQSV